MNLNKVFLAGRLARDPELRYSPAGLAVASFGIAINREWTDKSGEKKKEACFVDVSMFGKRAEVISEHLSKGNPIFIEGHLQLNQWETKEGQKKSALRVIADNFQFIKNRDFGYPCLQAWGGEIAPFARKIIKYLTSY